jgi:hypothetical protein
MGTLADLYTTSADLTECEYATPYLRPGRAPATRHIGLVGVSEKDVASLTMP